MGKEKSNIETFATVAFAFVLGHVERALHYSSQYVCVDKNGERHKSEQTRRLEITVHELHRLIDIWNGKEGL